MGVRRVCVSIIPLLHYFSCFCFGHFHPPIPCHSCILVWEKTRLLQSMKAKQFGGHGECYPSCALGNSWSLSFPMCYWLSDEHCGTCWTQFPKAIIDLDLWHKISAPWYLNDFLFCQIFEILFIICAKSFSVKLGIWKIFLLSGLNHRP
jgi:hypothetical protein